MEKESLRKKIPELRICKNSCHRRSRSTEYGPLSLLCRSLKLDLGFNSIFLAAPITQIPQKIINLAFGLENNEQFNCHDSLGLRILKIYEPLRKIDSPEHTFLTHYFITTDFLMRKTMLSPSQKATNC